MNIQWYPGHMTKTKRLIKENLSLVRCRHRNIDVSAQYSRNLRLIDLFNKKAKSMIFNKYRPI